MILSEISKIIIFLNFFYFFEIFKTYRFLWKFSKILYILWISGKKWSSHHWGRVTHICVSELTIIGSDNGLSPGRRQTIIWNNAGL